MGELGLILGGALARELLLRRDRQLFFLQRPFRLPDVDVQWFRLGHEVQNAIFSRTDFPLEVLDFVLKSSVLLVGFGAEHLIFQLGDLLLVHLDVAFQFLAVLLIGGKGSAIGFQAAEMGFQRFFENRDVLGQSGDFFVKSSNALIEGLKLNHQMRIWMHYHP